MRRFLLLVVLPVMVLSGLMATCPGQIDPFPTPALPHPSQPPVMTCPGTYPPSVKDYLPFSFVFTNTTELDASEIYVVVLVNSSKQYLSFSESAGHQVATIAEFTPSTYLSSPYDLDLNVVSGAPKYAYRLDEFEMTDPDTYTFYIPNTGRSGHPGSNFMTSSRILIALKQPLRYFINNTGLLQTPSEFDPTSDTYYILNDKIEFDLGSNDLNRLNLNLTWVDFFGLPFHVQANYKFLLGTTYSNACAVTGMPVSKSLADVLTSFNTATGKLIAPFDAYWSGLVAKYTNPGESEAHPMRIYAPATAMGSSFKQDNPSTVSFPTDYFLRSAYSDSGCSWFNAVWNGTTQSGEFAFYQNQKPEPAYLILVATTKNGAATAIGLEKGDMAFHFDIQGGPDKGKNVIFPFPTSSKAFFTGAVSDYEPAITSDASADTQAQVLKVFATSIISGFIPINCKVNPSITITNDYVQNHPKAYFQNNANLTSALTGCSCSRNIPWYDFYSRTLLTIGSPNFFYTSAYSDFLGTDGTIVIVNLNDHNADASIKVNLNDCSTGITFPDPYSDTTSYNVTIGLPAHVTVEHAASASGPWETTPTFTADGDQIFLKVTYNAGIYSGKTFVTQVAPAAKIFHPVLPGEGVVILSGTNDVAINIGAVNSSA